jgi:hypothetical protein
MEKLKKEREEEREKLIEEAETEVDKEQQLKREGAKPFNLATLCLSTYFGNGTTSNRNIFDQTAFLRHRRFLQSPNFTRIKTKLSWSGPMLYFFLSH